MAEKTYTAVVAHENVKVGRKVTTEPTPRMESLLGAGYYTAEEVALVADTANTGETGDWVDDLDDKSLLERFEELDVVEVVAEPPKRRAAVRRVTG